MHGVFQCTFTWKSFVAMMQTFAQTPLFRNTLVVWLKTRIMYLRLWAWLSVFAPFLWLAYASHTHTHIHTINLPFLSPTTALDRFLKNNCENSTIWITIIFHTTQLLHAHSFLSVEQKYPSFTVNSFSTTFEFHEKMYFSMALRETNERRRKKNERNEKLVSKVILI